MPNHHSGRNFFWQFLTLGQQDSQFPSHIRFIFENPAIRPYMTLTLIMFCTLVVVRTRSLPK